MTPIDTKAIRERAEKALGEFAELLVTKGDTETLNAWNAFGSSCHAQMFGLCDSLDSATARIAELEAILRDALACLAEPSEQVSPSFILGVCRDARKALEGKQP